MVPEAPAPALVAVTPALNAHLGSPTPLSDESGDCRSFLTLCKIHFEQHAPPFPTERSKVAYAITYLSGDAKKWATAEWQNSAAWLSSFKDFATALKQIFQETTSGREAAQKLLGLRQGRRSASKYAVEFRTLAAEVGWDSKVLCDIFVCGLAHRVKDSLAPLDIPSSLNELIALAIKIDRRLWNSDHERGEKLRGESGSPSLTPARRSSEV